jgi:hypothetical protein
MISDEGSKILAEFLYTDTKLTKCIKKKYLTKVNLYQNQISDVGGKYLAQSIGKNNTLKTLILFGNKLSDDSGMEFVTNLKLKSSITVLDVRNTSIHDEIIETINSYMKRNKGDLKESEIIPLPKWYNSALDTNSTVSDFQQDVDEESDRSENTKSVSSMSSDELMRTVKKMQHKIRGLEFGN